MVYRVAIEGKAAAVVEEALEESPNATAASVVSDALSAKRWLDENARAGRLYIKDGARFREVTLKK